MSGNAENQKRKLSALQLCHEASGARQTVHRADRKVTAEAEINWQRILFRCWQCREPYDEKRDLKAPEKSGSPLLKTIEAIRKNHPELCEQFS
ncbi:MAG: hypothetical protein Q7Q71_15425 [Verrucomicrobiota bacterium JB023]|nr:hypothetical protein [Verrucomicrobiota bacterium JB023]